MILRDSEVGALSVSLQENKKKDIKKEKIK
jgi:hypothetical protein